MVTSEVCAHVMRTVSTINLPVCSPGFIVNYIPFFILNFSIVLAIVMHMVAAVFLTNRGTRTHVASRLQQHIDTFTIGGNNAVSIA